MAVSATGRVYARSNGRVISIVSSSELPAMSIRPRPPVRVFPLTTMSRLLRMTIAGSVSCTKRLPRTSTPSDDPMPIAARAIAADGAGADAHGGSARDVRQDRTIYDVGRKGVGEPHDRAFPTMVLLRSSHDQLAARQERLVSSAELKDVPGAGRVPDAALRVVIRMQPRARHLERALVAARRDQAVHRVDVDRIVTHSGERAVLDGDGPSARGEMHCVCGRRHAAAVARNDRDAPDRDVGAAVAYHRHARHRVDGHVLHEHVAAVGEDERIVSVHLVANDDVHVDLWERTGSRQEHAHVAIARAARRLVVALALRLVDLPFAVGQTTTLGIVREHALDDPPDRRLGRNQRLNVEGVRVREDGDHTARRVRQRIPVDGQTLDRHAPRVAYAKEPCDVLTHDRRARSLDRDVLQATDGDARRARPPVGRRLAAATRVAPGGKVERSAALFAKIAQCARDSGRIVTLAGRETERVHGVSSGDTRCLSATPLVVRDPGWLQEVGAIESLLSPRVDMKRHEPLPVPD